MLFFVKSGGNFNKMQQVSLKSILLEYQEEFVSVVPLNSLRDKLLLLDFTNSNNEITGKILADTQAFTAYINRKLIEAGTRYGIGGYGEHRTIYSQSRVFDGDSKDEEPRRLHLGTDIWGKPNTPVMSPLNGIVHSFGFNNRFGDYGVTIVLSHVLNGLSFYTLYGHLSLNSIKNLSEGERINKGDVFAEFGIPAENGHWPSHLHFQIISDISDWKGDYPGVCKFSEKEKWLSNSPDPDLILQMNQYI